MQKEHGKYCQQKTGNNRTRKAQKKKKKKNKHQKAGTEKLKGKRKMR